MANRTVFGITIKAPDEFEEELRHGELDRFLTRPETREIIEEEVKPDAERYSGLSMIILGECVVLASDPRTLGNGLEFEAKTYGSREVLADDLHSVMIKDAKMCSEARMEYEGLKVYSSLPDEIVAEKLMAFAGLPIINRDETTGIFTEDVYRCPLLYKLLRHSGSADYVYFIAPEPNEGGFLVKKSLVGEQDLAARVVRENGRLIDVYEKWAAIAKSEGTIAAILPGSACIYSGCAGTRQDLVHPMNAAQRESLVSVTKPYR